MAYEKKDGFGAIFKNKQKAPDSKQPDYRGDIMLGGKLWSIAGWVKNGGSGPYLSLKGEEPRDKAETKRREPEDDSPIPF